MAGHEDEKRQETTEDYARFAPPGMAAASLNNASAQQPETVPSPPPAPIPLGETPAQVRPEEAGAPNGVSTAETPNAQRKAAHGIPVYSAPPMPPSGSSPARTPGSPAQPATAQPATAPSPEVPLAEAPPAVADPHSSPSPAPPGTDATPSYSWQTEKASTSSKATGLSEFQQPIEAIKFSPDGEEETPRRSAKEILRGLGTASWFGYTRNAVAVVSGSVTVLALVAWSVLSGTWSTFTEPANYSAVAFEVYEEEALQDQIAHAILTAIWEQYPPEHLAALLGSELYAPEAYDELPEEFHPYAWNFNTPAEIEQMMSAWLPPYIKERVAASDSKTAWMEANTSVHTAMIDLFEGNTQNTRDLIDIDLGSFRDTWMTESTGLEVMDELIARLDLKVSFIDAHMVNDLKSTYQVGKALRLILPVVAVLAFAIGLASARRRPWFLVGVGGALVAAWALAGPITQLPARYLIADDTSIGSIVLRQGLVNQASESDRFLMYLGIAGAISLAFGLVFGAMMRRSAQKAADLRAKQAGDTETAQDEKELATAR